MTVTSLAVSISTESARPCQTELNIKFDIEITFLFRLKRNILNKNENCYVIKEINKLIDAL